MSETSIWPPGLSTRAISAKTRGFSGERLITQLEITQSTEPSSTGRSSMMPLRTSTLVKLAGSDVLVRLGDHLVGHVHADHVTGRAYLLGCEEEVDAGAGAKVEHDLALHEVLRGRPGCRSRKS